MRFCMVTTFYPPFNFGGDGIFVRDLAGLLVSAGHQVRVVHCEDAYRLKTRMPIPDLPERYDDAGIEVCRLSSSAGILSPLVTQQLGVPGFKAKALRELLDGDFDVINFHNVSLVGGVGVLEFGASSLKLYTLHEHWLICATHILWKNGRKSCDRRSCLQCSVRSGIPPQLWRYGKSFRDKLLEIDTFISPSKFTAEQHRRIFPELPVKVLPHFSRIPSRADYQRSTSPGNSSLVFVVSGRVTASKGVSEVAELFAGIPHLKLVVAGDGDQLQSLREQYKGASNITFKGRLDVDDLISLYRRSTALILPSRAPETFGLSAVEAIASGVPILVRDSGGCREIVEATGAGFVYRTESELKGLIQRLASDSDLRTRLSAAAIEGYNNFYTPSHYLNEYLGLIAKLRIERHLDDWPQRSVTR